MSFTLFDKQNSKLRRHKAHDHLLTYVQYRRIPFYYAEEATNAIIPLLSDSYHSDKKRKFLPGLWEAFTKCQWVEPNDKSAKPQDRELRYRPGPSPPPEYKMGQLVGIKKLQ